MVYKIDLHTNNPTYPLENVLTNDLMKVLTSVLMKVLIKVLMKVLMKVLVKVWLGINNPGRTMVYIHYKQLLQGTIIRL